MYQVLERSSAQGLHDDDDDVEEISTIQHHSEDDGSAQKAADPVLSRPPTVSPRS